MIIDPKTGQKSFKLTIFTIMFPLAVCIWAVFPKGGNNVEAKSNSRTNKIDSVSDFDLYKYEDDTVVCYIYDGNRSGNMDCKWKKKNI